MCQARAVIVTGTIQQPFKFGSGDQNASANANDLEVFPCAFVGNTAPDTNRLSEIRPEAHRLTFRSTLCSHSLIHAIIFAELSINELRTDKPCQT